MPRRIRRGPSENLEGEGGGMAAKRALKARSTKEATRAKRTLRRKPRAASQTDIRPLAGRAGRGREWDPAQPDALAPAVPEVKEPRPYTSRYPIPNEEFESLKAAAPKARLPKPTAEAFRDSPRKKEEISARAMAAAPLG